MVWITEHHKYATFDVPSETDSSRLYKVSWGDNQYYDTVRDSNEQHSGDYDWSCTCGDWRFHKVSQGGYCKHILSVIDQRVLWATRNEDEIIIAVDSADFATMKGALDKDLSTDTMKALAGRIVKYAKFFAPVMGSDGNLIKVIKVTERDYRDILESGNNILVGGELDGKQFGMLATYLLGGGRREDLHRCVTEGRFYPDADYTVADTIVMDERCPECGAGRVPVEHLDTNRNTVVGHVCLNAACGKSVNNPEYIEHRREAVDAIRKQPA